MTDPMDYRDAVAQANAKKLLFLERVNVARNRVSPGRLKADAKEGIRNAAQGAVNGGKRTVRQHPVATTFAGVGLFAFLFRRQLCALVGWAKARRSSARSDVRTDEAPDQPYFDNTQPQPEISDEERY